MVFTIYEILCLSEELSFTLIFIFLFDLDLDFFPLGLHELLLKLLEPEERSLESRIWLLLLDGLSEPHLLFLCLETILLRRYYSYSFELVTL